MSVLRHFSALLFYSGGRKDPPELILAAFIGVALGIWGQRRAERTAIKRQRDVEDRANRNEINEDEAISLLVNHRFRQASRNLLETLGLFLLAIGAAAPFLAGFPFHQYWRPWGECLLLACFAVFFIFVSNLGFWIIEWFARRDVRKAIDEEPT